MKKKSKSKKPMIRPKKTESNFEIPRLEKHPEIEEVGPAESVEELAEREGRFEDDPPFDSAQDGSEY